MFNDFSMKFLVNMLFSILIVLVLSILVVFTVAENKKADGANWVRHTHAVISESKTFLGHMINAETGQRGFILIGEEEYLEPYADGIENARTSLYELENLTSDNHQQQIRINRISVLMEKKFDELKTTIELTKRGKKEEALVIVREKSGKIFMDDLRAVLASFVEVERTLLVERKATLESDILFLSWVQAFTGLLLFSIVILINRIMLRKVVNPIILLTRNVQKISSSENETNNNKNEIKSLSLAIDIMNEKIAQNTWKQEGVLLLNNELGGVSTAQEVASKSLDFLCNYLKTGVGVLYVFDEEKQILNQLASYAYVKRESLASSFALGEGTVGQVALQRSPIHLSNIQRTHMTIDTGTTSEAPLNTYTFPLVFQKELVGVIEVGSSVYLEDRFLELYSLCNTVIATAMASVKQSEKVDALLVTTKESNTLLQKQQDEVKEANIQMQEQQQQLEEANTQMEEQQQQLKSNTIMLKEKNDTLLSSQSQLDKKIKDLALSSKYKSEFLANMSHELRTPLNSIILLSDMLHDNKAQGMNEEEVKKASIIHESGKDLLRLIDDVLDLSKIEAGQMELIIDNFKSTDICEVFQNQFTYTAENKGIEFKVVDEYNGSVNNDKDRLSQILRNLMSNAMKFTKEGSVTLHISQTQDQKIKFSVIDTGIGIAKAKVLSIFEAFQQAEGGTSREYGGTGLGLSISKELAKLMKGEVLLESEEGKGSIFSIIIPNLTEGLDLSETQEPRETEEFNDVKTNKKVAEELIIQDDRKTISSTQETFLIIEDDKNFASILREKINDREEYALIALTARDGLDLAQQYNIKGVLLDLGLPDMDGMDVLKVFKTNASLRKIPVYIISGGDKEKITKDNGAFGYEQKPISSSVISSILEKINSFNKKTVKDLLIVEDNKTHRNALIEFLGNNSLRIKGVSTVSEAKQELKKRLYDGIILDIELDEGNGYDICEYIKEEKIDIPIIIYTGSNLTHEEEKKLRKYTDSIVIKTASSQVRLLDEVDIFMHRVSEKVQVDSNKAQDIDLSGKKILVVDDDIRNIYVLSEALGSQGAEIITASDGQEAIDILSENLDTNVVLMDIMMPVMNGYESTKIIKNSADTQNIPVIAVTAKAMQEDKDKAIEAGCDDFISKPLQMNILLGIVKGWLD